MNKHLKHSSGIPTELLLKMGHYDIKINDINFKTHVIDSAAGVDRYIALMRSRLKSGPKVVGIDHKKLDSCGSWGPLKIILILYTLDQCLIIHLNEVGTDEGPPESLDSFLSDPEICFVGITLPYNIIYYPERYFYNNVAVIVGELAARVLMNPELSDLTLSEVAEEVGIEYKHRLTFNATKFDYVTGLLVFTKEDVVGASYDAFMYYQIGFKLLASL